MIEITHITGRQIAAGRVLAGIGQDDLAKAADKVDDKVVDFNNAAAKDAYNLAVAKADGDRKVALANCLSLGGDAQKSCKDQAEADFGAARANAKAAALSLKQ